MLEIIKIRFEDYILSCNHNLIDGGNKLKIKRYISVATDRVCLLSLETDHVRALYLHRKTHHYPHDCRILLLYPHSKSCMKNVYYYLYGLINKISHLTVFLRKG